MFRFYAVTYGCRVNQYETQAIREWWQSLGGVETDEPAEADVILIDSCAVTAEAVSDARQMTRTKIPRLWRRFFHIFLCKKAKIFQS